MLTYEVKFIQLEGVLYFEIMSFNVMKGIIEGDIFIKKKLVVKQNVGCLLSRCRA